MIGDMGDDVCEPGFRIDVIEARGFDHRPPSSERAKIRRRRFGPECRPAWRRRDPVDELHTLDDFWQLVVAVETAPILLRAIDQLEHHGARDLVREASLRLDGPVPHGREGASETIQCIFMERGVGLYVHQFRGRGRRIMNSSLKLVCATAITIGSVVTTSEASSAMRIAPLPARSAALPVENVDWYCGAGSHLNPWGRCVPNYWRRGWYWRHGYYGHPGWSEGWYGHPGWQKEWHEHEHWDGHEHEYEEHNEH